MKFFRASPGNNKTEMKALLWIFVILLGILIFILIANAVSEGETNHFDLMILKSLRVQGNLHQPIGPEWVDLAMHDITSLGGGTVIVIITVIVVGFLLLQKNYSAMWLILIATIGGALVGLGLKELMGRERPPAIFHLVYVNTLSFPSGHSMISAVVYLTQAFLLSRIQKKKSIRVYIITVALILTFLIGISRIYLGVHYPTDVLAGWSIGFTWALLCWFVVWYLQERKGKMNPVKNH
jgi:undecaprenyl-diphosphatase